MGALMEKFEYADPPQDRKRKPPQQIIDDKVAMYAARQEPVLDERLIVATTKPSWFLEVVFYIGVAIRIILIGGGLMFWIGWLAWYMS